MSINVAVVNEMICLNKITLEFAIIFNLNFSYYFLHENNTDQQYEPQQLKTKDENNSGKKGRRIVLPANENSDTNVIWFGWASFVNFESKLDCTNYKVGTARPAIWMQGIHFPT